MADTYIDGEIHLANNKPNRRVANRRVQLQDKTLLNKEMAGATLIDSEKRYRRLFESAKDGILILDAGTGKIVDVNPFLMQLLGFSYNEFHGKHLWEVGTFKDIAASKEAFNKLQDNEYIRYDDLPLKTLYGRSVAVEFISNVYLEGDTKVIQCNIRDITARKWAEAERKQLLAAIEQTGEAIVMTDAQGVMQYVNPAFERTTGYSKEEAIGQNPRLLKSNKQDEMFYQNLWETISTGKTWTGHMVNKRKDGTLYTEETTISPVYDPAGQIVNYVAVQRDITKHLLLTAQLQQAQKMEAVGLLAGGVAHDFNNMLSIILGYTEMALSKVDPAEPLHADLEEVLHAANRSADITRQLLTFARKEAILPVVLDLNKAVENMLKMLRRLIGENLELSWQPTEGLYSIMIDPVQVDQILVNLCVNAKDAIAGLGKLTIQTENEVINEAYCAQHPGFEAGEYVLLSVSDNGCGMDKETIAKIFEPFYTSKAVGHGTGLGLSTIYGIVKQNNGFINVSSEPDKGTTFRIYLPRYRTCQAFDIKRKITTGIPLGQGETVLVVEDEPSLLKMNQQLLERLGYRVLTAGTPGQAISLAEEHTNEIDLLLTDVVMPEMNGRELAKHMRSRHPKMKILFMSGYTIDIIAYRGVLDEGVDFLQKPCTLKDLAIKVHDALEKSV